MAIKKAKAKKAVKGKTVKAVEKPKKKKNIKPAAVKKSKYTKKDSAVKIMSKQEMKEYNMKIMVVVGFIFILAASMFMRLDQPDWYNERQFHPDERWIVSNAVASLNHWGEKPIGLQYGSLPMYLLMVQKDITGWMHRQHIIKDLNKWRIGGARVMSGLVETLTVVFIFLIALLLFGPKIALLSSLLLGFTVLNIHAAHFFTTDTFMTLFVAATIYFSARIYKYGTLKNYIFAGIFLAAAVASKTASAPLVAVVLLAHILNLISIKGTSKENKVQRINSWINFTWLILVAGIAFFAFMPHAILSTDKMMSDLGHQKNILITGEGDVPYNRQYLDTPPYLFQMKNMILYTMGIPYGSVAFLAFFFYIGVMINSIRKGKMPDKEILLILAWLIPYFMIVGNSFAKFNRYMIPMTPFLAILCAKFIFDLYKWIKNKKVVHAIAWTVALGSMFYGISFMNIYHKPHAWIEASEWIYKNIPVMNNSVNPPRKTKILNEMWGDDLPTYARGGSPGQYHNVKWAVQEPDSPRKMAELPAKLAEVDYVMMADKRAKGTYMRLPGMYPINYFYYSTMLTNPEKLGYKLVHEYTSYPALFGIKALEMKDDKSDESFKLYDHPHVHIFKNEKHLPASELYRIIDEGQKKVTEKYGVWKKDVKRIDKHASEELTEPNKNIGALKDRIHSAIPSISVFMWYVLIQVLAFLVWPLHFSLFGNFRDKGYGLAKISGLFLFAWVNWILVSAGVWKFYQVNLWILLAVFSGAAVFYYVKNSNKVKEFSAQNRRHILITEIVFLSAYMLFILIKLWAPDIHNIMGQGYRGGGEPMGMAYLSAIFNDTSFPPHDPWLSGFTLNYYYWGQLMLATASKLLGFLPRITYNLSLSLLFALSFLGAFTVTYNMTGKYRYGILSGFFLAMAGNFHTLVYMFENLVNANTIGGFFNRIGRFEFIWNPSRVYRPNSAITEMPFFSYLYGDLHAHNIVIPVTILAIAVLMNIVMSANKSTNIIYSVGETKGKAALNIFIIALVLGSMLTINTWNFPPVFIFYGMVFVFAGVLLYRNYTVNKNTSYAGKAANMAKSIIVPVLTVVGVAAAAYLLFVPFHNNFHSPYKTVVKFISKTERASMFQMFQYFSVFFFIIWTYVMFAWMNGFRKFAKDSGIITKRGFDMDELGERISDIFYNIFSSTGLTVKFSLTAVNFIIALILSFAVQPTFGILYIMIVTVLWKLFTSESVIERFSLLAVFLSLGIVLGVDMVFVADGRMNTVFKFYMVAWTFLGVSVPYLMFAVISEMKELFSKDKRNLIFTSLSAIVFLTVITMLKLIDAKKGTTMYEVFFILSVIFGSLTLFIFKNKIGKYIFTGCFVFLMIPAVLYPVGSAFIRMNLCSNGFKQKPRIDGMKYLETVNPRGGMGAKDFDSYDYQAMEWMNSNISSIDPVLEAPGNEMYKGLSRISIFTGMPTLVGWGYQVGQQSGRGGEVNQRNRDAEEIYRTADAERAKDILNKYRIPYVYVGSIEKKLYGTNVDKFSKIGEMIYKNDQSEIFKINMAEQKK